MTGVERRDENEKEDAKLFRLTPDWRQRCPCATDWDEGALTLRLASHEASVIVSPFNFVLAPPIRDPRIGAQEARMSAKKTIGLRVESSQAEEEIAKIPL